MEIPVHFHLDFHLHFSPITSFPDEWVDGFQCQHSLDGLKREENNIVLQSGAPLFCLVDCAWPEQRTLERTPFSGSGLVAGGALGGVVT
jgi:hypothetical protein